MKFSIRDLLLVTVIVALAVGWWIDHRRSEIAKREDAFPLWEKIDKLEAELDNAEKSAATACTSWVITSHQRTFSGPALPQFLMVATNSAPFAVGPDASG